MVVKAFSLQKSCQDAGRSGSQLVRGRVNMADEAKLCSPIHSTFESLVVPSAVRHCHREELGPFCWPILAAGTAVFSASHQAAEQTSHMSWLHWDSESCSGSNQQLNTKQWPWIFLGGNFGFGKCFGASSESNHWVGCCWLYKIHFLSHVKIQSRNGSLLLQIIKEDDTSKWQFFDLWSANEAPTYRVFTPFQFASNAK